MIKISVSLLLLAALAIPANAEGQFVFGSYGRVGVSDTGGGERGEQRQIVPFAPRIGLGSYLELDFGWLNDQGKAGKVRTLTTIALGDSLFHYNGEFNADLAIRQALVEIRDIGGQGYFAWVGSRMYRGDDIYLLNFWPLDELNTVGAAFGWESNDAKLELHAGLNRLAQGGNQYQRVPVPANDFGAEEVTTLDRQRRIVSLLAEQRWGGRNGRLGKKLKIYGEVHHLPKGRETLAPGFSDQRPLPDDRGWMLGLQGGLWNFPSSIAARGHLNVWLRLASGLAAFDELAQPYGLNRERRSVDAQEVRGAFSGNLERGQLGLMFGGYIRAFTDADGQDEDFDDRIEGAGALRALWLNGYFTPGIEASVQMSRPNGLNPRTEEQNVAQVTQLALIPAWSLGPNAGSYTRPQLHLVAAVSLLNQGALDLYAEADPRSTEETAWFFGAGAEWWFGRGGGY